MRFRDRLKVAWWALRGLKSTSPYTWPVWAGETDWPSPTFENFVTQGYERNELIYRCITVKAQTAAMAPLVAYEGERAEPERLADDAPLAQLLVRPNPAFSPFELQELLMIYLNLDGNAFILKEPKSERDNTVVGLWPLRPDRVSPVPKDGEILGYVYRSESGQKTPFVAEDIIHVKLPNPADRYEGLGRGKSWIASCARSANVDNKATSFIGAFFDNAACPFGLLKAKARLSDSRVAEIRARLKAQYAGSSNWHEIMILDTEADYQAVGMSFKEMVFETLDARSEARICEASGVPPIIAGALIGLRQATYSNYEQARRAFWEDTMIVEYQRFEDAYNLGLNEEFPRQWVAYDFSRVPALREDEGEKWKQAGEGVRGGWVTINEGRARVGLPPVEGGEVLLIPLAVVAQSAPVQKALPGWRLMKAPELQAPVKKN